MRFVAVFPRFLLFNVGGGEEKAAARGIKKIAIFR